MKLLQKQLRTANHQAPGAPALRDALYYRDEGKKARPVLMLRPTLNQLEARLRGITRARRKLLKAPKLDVVRLSALAKMKANVVAYLNGITKLA